MKHLASVAGVKEEGLGRPSPSPSIRALPPPPRAPSPVRRLLRKLCKTLQVSIEDNV